MVSHQLQCGEVKECLFVLEDPCVTRGEVLDGLSNLLDFFNNISKKHYYIIYLILVQQLTEMSRLLILSPFYHHVFSPDNRHDISIRSHVPACPLSLEPWQ